MLDLELMVTSVPRLLGGVWLTLLLTASIVALGLVLAVVVAAAHLSRHRSLRLAAEGYMLFFRGTPALVQVFLIYYGASQFEWLRGTPLWIALREPFWCVIIALGLNSGAYVGYMLSGAAKALPPGPVEAARALGLTTLQTTWTVRLPLIVRAILPAYGNEAILTLKATSLAATVTLLELTGTARELVSETYAPFEVFTVAGAIYLVLTFVLTLGFRAAERRLQLPAG